MLYMISAMADHVGECNMINTQLLEYAFSVDCIKKEECQDDHFAENKVDISETAIIIDNVKLKDHVISAKMKQDDTSITLENIKTELAVSEVHYDMLLHNLKVEDRISVGNVKIESNTGLLYCENCQAYCEDYCTKCGMLLHILNRTALINADSIPQEELPNNILELRNCFGQFQIFALKVIPAGVRFGPFIGLYRTEHMWKIKGGKFVANKDTSKYLNWMQYIRPARNIYEQNLFVIQYKHNLYYQSTRHIQEGEELLVYFGEEYEDSLNRNVEMDFIPAAENSFKDAYACTYCCLGFSSKSYLAKHKAIYHENAHRGFLIEELMQCPFCEIHLDHKEYIMHHMTYCCEINDRKCILRTPSDPTAQVSRRKTRQPQIYKCQQCKYCTKYKGDLKKHTRMHYEVKLYKCGVCCRRFKTKEVLRLHVENAHVCADRKDDFEHFTGVYTNADIKTEESWSQEEMKQFKCLLCEFRTKYKINLTRHLVKHSTAFNYKCQTCNYKSNWKHHLKRHIETRHLNVLKYKCDACDYKTNYNYHLKTHIATRHLNEIKYKCGTCDYKTNRNDHLRTHIETKHLNELKYKCDRCDYKTNWKSALRGHIETIHLNVYRYKCDGCGFKSNRKTALKSHIETKHLNIFKYKCETCHYKTNQKCHLKSHTEARHTKEIKYVGDCETNLKSELKADVEARYLKEFKYKCETCDYKTNWKSALKSHVEARHLKEFKYKCEACDYKANRMSHLKVHTVARHLKEFKYKCDECEYKANRKCHLKTHIEAKHSEEFKYKCDLCDYRSNWKSTLMKHIKTKHLKEFKYKCDTCDYKTNWKSSLRAHVEAKEAKEFKYNCDKCDYKAKWKHVLKEHIEARHLKEFKYKCDTCDYRSNWKSTLMKHVKTKHLKLFKYKCDTCDYKTNLKSNLTRHVDRTHL